MSQTCLSTLWRHSINWWLGHRLTGQQVWVEQKEDYRFDEYGNRIPDRYLRPEYASVPRPYRTRL